MSRFMDSLKIKAHLHRTVRSGKRSHDTQVRYFWCRETGPQNGHAHYHMLILVNKNTFHSLGSFHRQGNNLGNYIIEAWLSGLGISPDIVADPERLYPTGAFS
ncbi:MULTISPECIES: inovirus-type Gp2 protein [Enterobacteriaceae]